MLKWQKFPYRPVASNGNHIWISNKVSAFLDHYLGISFCRVVLEAINAGANKTEAFTVYPQKVKANIKIEKFLGYESANKIKIFQGSVFLGQIEERGKSLFLKTLEVVKFIAFKLFFDPLTNSFHPALVLMHWLLCIQKSGQD
jgi:hypothetical protein